MAGRAVDFLRLRGRLEASPFHFINLGVLAYIGMGQVRAGKQSKSISVAALRLSCREWFLRGRGPFPRRAHPMLAPVQSRSRRACRPAKINLGAR